MQEGDSPTAVMAREIENLQQKLLHITEDIKETQWALDPKGLASNDMLSENLQYRELIKGKYSWSHQSHNFNSCSALCRPPQELMLACHSSTAPHHAQPSFEIVFQ